jgi:flavin reductase (DIM6/NTAB) family NADH-FMN oxidoreductase RutF
MSPQGHPPHVFSRCRASAESMAVAGIDSVDAGERRSRLAGRPARAILDGMGTSEAVTATGVDPFAYRRAIGHFATGVAVVTAADEAGHGIHGMTANAVTSVSLSPVLLAVCIGHDLPTHGAIRATRRFNVNLLRADQQHLAHQFARPSANKFAGVELLPGRAVPVLADALAHFECSLYEEVTAGDHSIFIGHVEACDSHDGPQVDPLLYFRSSFYGLAVPAAGA